jgi:hypothetical protein
LRGALAPVAANEDGQPPLDVATAEFKAPASFVRGRKDRRVDPRVAVFAPAGPSKFVSKAASLVETAAHNGQPAADRIAGGDEPRNLLRQTSLAIAIGAHAQTEPPVDYVVTLGDQPLERARAYGIVANGRGTASPSDARALSLGGLHDVRAQRRERRRDTHSQGTTADDPSTPHHMNSIRPHNASVNRRADNRLAKRPLKIWLYYGNDET